MRKTKGAGKLLTAALCLSVMLAGCGTKGGGEKSGAQDAGGDAKGGGKPVELVFYSTNGDPEDSFDYRFGDALRKKFPNYTIKYIQNTKGNSLPELLTAGTKFDIFFISTGNYESLMFPNELQIDMDPLAKKHGVDLSRLEPTVVDAIRQSSGGKLYGIPVFTNNMVLYYNKSLFDKFGVSYPRDDMTWDDTLEIAKKMTREEGGTQYFGFSTSANHMLRMNELSIPNVDLASEKPTINSDEKWRRFFQTVFLDPYQIQGYTDSLTKSNKVPDYNVFLKDQTLAMYAYLSSLAYVLPDDMKPVNWDMVSLPVFKEKPGVGSQSYPFYFGITKLSSHPDEAMEVLKYMVSDEFQTDLAKKGIMPVLKDEAIRKTLGQDSPFKDKHFAAVFANAFAPIPPKAVYDADIVAIYSKYADQVQKQKLDINTAFRQADEEAAKFIAAEKSK